MTDEVIQRDISTLLQVFPVVGDVTSATEAMTFGEVGGIFFDAVRQVLVRQIRVAWLSLP
jgi:hypothetical protein